MLKVFNKNPYKITLKSKEQIHMSEDFPSRESLWKPKHFLLLIKCSKPACPQKLVYQTLTEVINSGQTAYPESISGLKYHAQASYSTDLLPLCSDLSWNVPHLGTVALYLRLWSIPRLIRFLGAFVPCEKLHYRISQDFISPKH